jgi:N-acyl-D-amino-acid deacylase
LVISARLLFPLCSLFFLLSGCAQPVVYDVILRGGTIYDGSGQPGRVADLAIQGDRIATIGDLSGATSPNDIDAKGLAVAPGFINMMSWANESLLQDGRSQSDIRQGVTLEVMGEGHSMGPLSPTMKQQMQKHQGDIKYEVAWNTLGEYLSHLEKQGVSTNVASFIGAATPRIYVIGYNDRKATPEELEKMKELVREAMREGAMGVASSLIYPPGHFADTAELIELAKAAGEYDGLYASHIRNEANRLVESVEEAIAIGRGAGVRVEIYHLKAAGKPNWALFDKALETIEAAQKDGLEITADVYTYPASSTGLNSVMPPWVQEGGFSESIRRMKNRATRARIKREMNQESDAWENMWLGAGSPENILLVGFRSEKLKPLAGKTIAEIARMRRASPEDTVMDLIIEDGSRIQTIYFSQSIDNLRKAIRKPWVSFCSDAASLAAEGVFLKNSTHPRAYGSFARVPGQFVREEGLIPLEEAIRKLAALPAKTLRLDRRGELKEGYFADVVVFDPKTISDKATFTQPHQYAVGMKHVFVNGGQVLREGEHTGAKPGRFVKGPGARSEATEQ